MRPVLRRVLLILAALALGALGALAERQRQHVVRVDLGSVLDGPAARSGWHAREQAFTLAGRWTDGQAIAQTPRAGRYVTAVRLGVCGHPRRGVDQVRVGAGPLDVELVRVSSGCQVVEVPVRLAAADAALTIDLASAATSGPGDARPLGIFVDWIEVEADGGVAWGRDRAVWWIALLLAATLLAGWDGLAIATGTRLAGPAMGAALAGAIVWTAVALLVPRVEDLRHGALWAIGLAALLGAARALRPRAREVRREAQATPPRLAWGLLAIGGVLAIVFRETILEGRVLSQSNLIYQVFPWRAALPPDYVIGNRLLGDIPLVFYPFLVHLRDALAAWTFPLWSVNLYTGHPFFASFQSAVLSPFTWIAVAVPLPWGTVAGAAARMATGGLGAFAFTRRLGLGTAACTFCAIVYSLNTFSFVWLEHPPSAVAAWLPWLLWAAEHVADRRDGRAAAALALIVAASVFAGHPETALKALAVGGLYGLATAGASARPWRAVAWVCGAYALGLLLTSVQVLPFAEYLRESRAFATRQTTDTNPYILPGDVAITTLVPDFWGHPVSDDYLLRPSRLGIPSNYNEQQIYPGVVTWVLAVVGLVTGWRRWRVLFFAATVVGAAALAFSVPRYLDYFISLPVLRVTMVSRFGLVVEMAVMVLAAFGVDAIARPAASVKGAAREASWRPVWGAVVAALAIAAFVAWALARFDGFLIAGGLLVRAATGGLFAAALAAATAALIAGAARGHVHRPVAGAAICVLVGAELVAFTIGYRTFVRPAEVFPRVEGLEAIRRDPGLFRAIGIGQVLPSNTAMVYGIADPRGYDGMGPRRLNDLLDVSFVFLASYHATQRVDKSPIIDLLNVKYIVGRPGEALPSPQFTRVDAGGAPVFLNHAALPRTFLVDGFTVASGNPARRLLRDRGVDPRRVAILEETLSADAAPEAAAAPAGPGEIGHVEVRHYRSDYVEMTTAAPGRRLLVLTDLFYPGWIAEVDGQPAPIRLANFAFRAVSVPAGTHTVRFVYRPKSLFWGAAVSAVALLVLVGLTWIAPRPTPTS